MNFIEVFLGTYLVVTLIFSALFALIPAKVASNKGYSFGLWWLYGFFLWIIAMIHVTLITDLEAERRKKEASQIKPNNDGTLSEETMKKYNGLIKSGLVSQDEFGVKKKEILQTYVSQQSSPETTTRKIVGTKESLLKRANLFLEDGDWNAVYDYSETVLDMDPECAEAYLLKLMLEAKATSMDELKSLSKPLTEYSSYNKVIRFADENLKSELQNCNESIINKNMDNIYNNALSMMQNANTEQDLQKAISLFDQVPDYKDAKDLIEECNISINGIKNDKILHNAKSHMEKGTIEGYKTAIRFLRSISDWKNSQELIEECNQGIEAIQEKVKADLLEKERQEELKRQEELRRAKRNKKIALISLMIVGVIIAITFVITNVVIPNINYEQNMSMLMNAKQGDIVYFGNYNDQKIEWIVLEKQDDKMLVLSENSLTKKPYNENDSEVTWESCTLREWLNSEFISEAFNYKEESTINVTKVTADKNPAYDTNPGDDQEDKIFLLSAKEVNKYLNESIDRVCVGQSGVNVYWWLRTPGYKSNNAMYVRSNGDISEDGYTVIDNGNEVRPAMWINLNN